MYKFLNNLKLWQSIQIKLNRFKKFQADSNNFYQIFKLFQKVF